MKGKFGRILGDFEVERYEGKRVTVTDILDRRRTRSSILWR